MGELSSRNRLSPIRCKNKCCTCLKTFVFFASIIRFLDRRVGAYILSIFPSPTRPPLDLLPPDRPAFFLCRGKFRSISFWEPSRGIVAGTGHGNPNCGLGCRDTTEKKVHNSPKCHMMTPFLPPILSPSPSSLPPCSPFYEKTPRERRKNELCVGEGIWDGLAEGWSGGKMVWAVSARFWMSKRRCVSDALPAV